MKKKILIIFIFAILFPLISSARSLDTLQIKVVENGKALYCLDKYIACYLPKYNLVVFDNSLMNYPAEFVIHTILHEICHHLTYKEDDTYEIREMRADICAYKFEQLLKNK